MMIFPHVIIHAELALAPFDSHGGARRNRDVPWETCLVISFSIRAGIVLQYALA